MKIVEFIEQYIANNLNDSNTYTIHVCDIPLLSSLTNTNIDYSQICLYAMHEIITVNSTSKHKLFLKFQYTNDIFTAVINNDVKDYFKTLI